MAATASRSMDPEELAIHLSPGTARDLAHNRGARTTISHFDDSSDDEEEDHPRDMGQFSEDDREIQTPTMAGHSHIPLHPIPSMQEAFAESLEEATKAGLSLKPALRQLDAKARREKLLDEDRSKGPPNRAWRFRSGQKCHELRKLVAQISFGIELLLKGMANNNAQVLSILQGHIDEVDEFLETAMEDVKEASKDLKDRMEFLKVPMENMEVFEQMLENRKFRLQIVEGNAKIEHILARTSTAHTQTIRDVAEGLRAVKQFARYLKENDKGVWRRERLDVVDVFDAMKGNAEGWLKEFTTLESSSTLLSGLLVQLSSMIVDIDKKAGEISRRTRFTLDPYSKSDRRSANPHDEPPSSEATPPPSPPASSSSSSATPRIRTLDFGHSLGSFLGPQENGMGGTISEIPDIPLRAKQRITKDSDTLQTYILSSNTYTPPESSKRIPEVIVDDGSQTDREAEIESVAESRTTASTASSKEDEEQSEEEDEEDEEQEKEEEQQDDNDFILLQPRTYTPVPPAPSPSPRASPKPPLTPVERPKQTLERPKQTLDHAKRSSERLKQPTERPQPSLEPTTQFPAPPRTAIAHRGANRGTPDELSIHIEVDEDIPQSPDEIHETVLMVPQREMMRAPIRAQPKILQIQPVQRQSRSSDKEVVLSHKTSLRERVSLKGELPTAIHVPPMNAFEIPRPRLQTPQGSPRSQRSERSQRPPNSSHGTEAGSRRTETRQRTTNVDYVPPRFPNLIASPASERQHFRPVQASPHSPLQQRPHTAGTVVNRSGHRDHRGAPSQMGMSMLSTVTTMHENASNKAGSTRTVKKKRSAFGWLKKAFSLDEEERAAFEARRRAQPANYYQYQMPPVDSPRYLDGRRIS
ncbi:hypothetical protein BD289DRAFT_482142 [Coniella lustricola]|uniref:Uncharacterized protein n=1 Tax=Coniella lustricola TaxID=2025994 RepID=A0A2T3A9W3_9PEZI|nr:hypothetical protein BD289DRAFT_482142 [Coniella lustricola]